MSRRTLSRRDALGVIGKTGVALGVGTYFFLSLKTSPLAGTLGEPPITGSGRAQAPRHQAVPHVPEKVVVSGSGSTLTAKVSGTSGRHYAAAFATTDARERYQAVANARGIIGANGIGTIQVDVRGLPDGKVFLRVVTGNTNAFNDDIAGTEAFIVHISKGTIVRYEGLMSRPMENSKSGGITVASFAAACASVKR